MLLNRFSFEKLDIHRNNLYKSQDLYSESASEYENLVEEIDKNYKKTKDKIKNDLATLSTNEEFLDILDEYERLNERSKRIFHQKAGEIKNYYLNNGAIAAQNVSRFEEEFKSEKELEALLIRIRDYFPQLENLTKHPKLGNSGWKTPRQAAMV
ncbi:hypothetical protein [Mycoplasma phocimorsus]|uniref:hypothetical protein n=1 Tax=Mycoplasma phocimorsus TaxID=3045839 RepID=UPI0024BF63B1|nr:hypothetical protein [Mycoplasma phocimorsus]MDJ1647234.1 hypothetical protein [Mycoplasma phocimorsus]MDJ1648411.1 hypothetical protein [Mycoplasma phocimorsus]